MHKFLEQEQLGQSQKDEKAAGIGHGNQKDAGRYGRIDLKFVERERNENAGQTGNHQVAEHGYADDDADFGMFGKPEMRDGANKHGKENAV